MDDNKIIALYEARDEDAIHATAEKYDRLCFGIAKNILRDEGEAEECVNDTYLGVWNAIPPEKPQNLTAFVCKIVRNIALKRFSFRTAAKRNADVMISLSELETVLPGTSRIHDEMDEKILSKHIETFLQGENETVRRVFLRKYWFFDSLTDIAEHFGFSESKVKSMLFHTRNKLKEYLQKEGYEL